MGRMSGIKWEKATQCRPVHNIISSDFPKYNPQPWKFMEGKSRIEWLLSYEYQRMWIKEIEAWKKRMFEGIKGKLDSKRPPNDKAMRGSMDQQNSKKI
ncbi:hypothetical protein HF086_005720 [Spodoptera exigua]|uniref:Uncharacterized protein n=1 Tax=Spodoptera exigua TaxID=7107 RepID=A0A922MXN2_SPOEX|nr:hypothetical protein HF086_005720 [Spodoptera exigua]